MCDAMKSSYLTDEENMISNHLYFQYGTRKYDLKKKLYSKNEDEKFNGTAITYLFLFGNSEVKPKHV